MRYSPLEVVVVDNNSEDGTASMVKSEFPEIRFYQMNSNKGVGARNAGISEATGEAVITLDDDVIGIGDREVNAVVRLFQERPDVGAICFKILDYETGMVCNWCHHYRKENYSNREFLTDEITEGAVAFRKSALARSGLYPEYFFISHEGQDLLVRLLEAGFKTIYSPEICVRHHTAPQGRQDWRRYYYDTRNQIWLAVRNFPVVWTTRYLLRGLTAMLFYSIRDGFVSYWIKGVADGIRGMTEAARDRRPISLTTRKILSEIASKRPGLGYILKERLFKRGVRL
jgi:GT2 family glycosyltransferase